MLTEKRLEALRQEASEIRRLVIERGYALGQHGMHFGGTLSMVEIMVALYGAVMDIAEDPKSEQRDRFILSKGHGVFAQYAAMWKRGLLTKAHIDSFKDDFSIFSAHPAFHPELGIEYASGSLGQGLSLGVGVSLALRLKGEHGRVFVLVGDGECNEGSIWEAAMSAAHFGLSRLILVVDKNGIQYDGETSHVMDMGSLQEKFISFGWMAVETDGHDIAKLTADLSQKSEKPLAVIADTIKGKGISFMENNPAWHHSILSHKLFEQAISELERGQVCNIQA